MAPRINLETRSQVIFFRRIGISYRVIAGTLDVLYNTCWYIIKRFSERGDIVD